MPVKILAPDVIAKIAAGEVVDRPSSVIKELIENSIDAGSTHIEITLKDAGKELIIIKDNGCGIRHEDLPILFNRHATSKINNIDDLETLSSMGFRGEALYSIGAVSDVIIKTKIEDSALLNEKKGAVPYFSGWQIHVQGGKRISLEPVALASHGTEIHIAQLFFNTPARRKFLKSTTSEINSIINVITPYTLIYPSIRFHVLHNGKSLIDVRPAQNTIERVAEMFNVKSSDLMVASQEFAQDNISISLVLGNINIQRARRDMQYYIINKRPIESKQLSFAMHDIYKLIMPPGAYGAFVLQIDIDPATIDVNIHPTKREVRIHQETRIVSLVRKLTEYTLMQQGQAKAIAFASPGHQDTGSPENMNGLQGLPVEQMIWGPKEKQLEATSWKQKQDNNSSIQHLASSNTNNYSLFSNNENALHERLARARYIGQFMNKYQLFEDGDALLVIDHHAAQERIMFEKFTKQIESSTIETQPLLTPVLMPLSISEKVIWEDINDKLELLGIETTLFDDKTLAIQTQPLLLKNIERSVRHLLAEKDIAKCDRNTIARRACKASIVAGDAITPLEADNQRKQLLKCDDPFICPHGRPTVISVTDDFLERQFLRV